MSALPQAAQSAPPPALRPSEYTALLVQALHERAACLRDARVLDMGCGSGVVLAAACALGARSVCGVDIEDEAVRASAALLQARAHVETQIVRGNLWEGVPDGHYDVVLANLPQFPLAATDLPGRLPSWSAGGRDGRLLLDPFLDGLGSRLASGGRALLAHNAFIGIDATRRRLARHGLALETVMRTLVAIPTEKMARMTPAILAAETGRTLRRFGPYAFGEVHTVEVMHRKR